MPHRPSLVLILVFAGCSFDWDGFDPRVMGAGGTASGGSGGAGGQLGSGGSGGAGDGGFGGAAPICGDGVRAGTEECDDGNLDEADGCDGACRVECPVEGLKDPQSHHCYLLQTELTDWAQARASCLALGPGVDLAALSSQPELDLVLAWEPVSEVIAAAGEIHLGARETAVDDVFEWLNGEPFALLAWLPDEPNDYGGVSEECLDLRAKLEAIGFNDQDCNILEPALCERSAAGR